MKKITGLIAALALGIAALTGCGASEHDRSGDPGKVSGREKEYKSSTKSYDYDLTVTRPDGTSYEIDVTSSAYDHCYRGSAYPKCVDK